MKIRKWAVLYSLIVGVSMIGMWTMFLHPAGSRAQDQALKSTLIRRRVIDGRSAPHRGWG